MADIIKMRDAVLARISPAGSVIAGMLPIVSGCKVIIENAKVLGRHEPCQPDVPVIFHNQPDGVVDREAPVGTDLHILSRRHRPTRGAT